MISGPIWIVPYSFIPFAGAWLLCRAFVKDGATLSDWFWYLVFSLLIAGSAGAVASLLLFEALDEFMGVDWLNIHPNGLGSPDPFFDAHSLTWLFFGALIGSSLAVAVRYLLHRT